MNINVIELDNKDYYFLKKMNVNNNIYCYFSNVNDKYDLCIRKLVLENGEYVLIGLDDEKELLTALEHFDDNNK